MDKIEASGKAGEKQVNDLAEAQRKLGNLERPFGFRDVAKIAVWTLILFLLLRMWVVREFMDNESDRELTDTVCFNVFLFLVPLVISAMTHFSWKREQCERLKDKIKSLTSNDHLQQQGEVSETPPNVNQTNRPQKRISKGQLVGLILLFVGALMLLGFLIIGMVAGIIILFDPDFFQNDVMKFIASLFDIVGFFGGLFFVIFTLVIGGHAAISKDPIEKNLSEGMLKRRLKNAVIYMILLLWGAYELKKFRDWWHKKS
jgi:hypothetical protein